MDTKKIKKLYANIPAKIQERLLEKYPEINGGLVMYRWYRKISDSNIIVQHHGEKDMVVTGILGILTTTGH